LNEERATGFPRARRVGPVEIIGRNESNESSQSEAGSWGPATDIFLRKNLQAAFRPQARRSKVHPSFATRIAKPNLVNVLLNCVLTLRQNRSATGVQRAPRETWTERVEYLFPLDLATADATPERNLPGVAGFWNRNRK